MVGAFSIQSYTWSSSRCNSLGVFQIASLFDLCLSLVSLFSQHWACLLPDAVVPLFPLLCVVPFRASQFLSSRNLAEGRVQNFPASRSSSELSSHQISTRTGSSKLPCQCQLIRAEHLSNLYQSSFGSLRQDSTPVSWVEHHYSQRAVQLCTSTSSLTTPSEASRHCTCARRRVRHYSILRLYGAVASASPFPCSPSVFGWFLALLCSYEGDGTGPPRPPESSARPFSPRAGQAGPRFNVLLGGLLVDASRRQSSTLFPPLRCLSLGRSMASSLLDSIATLRPVVQLLGPS